VPSWRGPSGTPDRLFLISVEGRARLLRLPDAIVLQDECTINQARSTCQMPDPTISPDQNFFVSYLRASADTHNEAVVSRLALAGILDWLDEPLRMDQAASGLRATYASAALTIAPVAFTAALPWPINHESSPEPRLIAMAERSASCVVSR
jgi:hypothetical protein